MEQSRLIRELAEQSDCVIVGRCADQILSELEPFRIFVYADMDSKIRRCMEKATEKEPLTERELKNISWISTEPEQSIMAFIPTGNGEIS